MRSVLFVGGPNDGAVLNVAPTLSVVVLMAPESSALLASGAWEDVAAAEPVRTAYGLHDLVIFGRTVTIGAPPGLHGDALNQAAARHLLTPLARNLMDDAQ